MARTPRKLSATGYMHVIVRGIGKQVLFNERPDYKFYLSILKKYSIETGISIVAYCMMENHVHLLLYDPGQNVSLFMKKMGIRYSQYFNYKYDRAGHLFQDRFLSEPIENEGYLLTVFRYILQNPQKAGICTAKNYEWSSYAQFDDPRAFVDTSAIKPVIGDREQFEFFMKEQQEDDCLEYERPKRDDNWARSVLCDALGVRSGTEIQGFDRKRRDAAIRELKRAGLNIKQIERLTGINRGVVQKA